MQCWCTTIRVCNKTIWGESMKKNVLVIIGERTEIRERIVPAVYGEDGELLTPETVEQYTVTVPIMEARNVDMTPEEIAEFERQQEELSEPEPTPEERLDKLEPRTDALEDTTDDMILLMADLIGGM